MTEDKPLNKEMKSNKWKILTIILIGVLVLENFLIFLGYIVMEQEEEKTMECYYTICKDNADALYSDNLCTCYEYDTLGYLQEVKTEYMG